MFWQSVLGGFSVLVHWQVWVALVLYVALILGWLIGIGLLIGNSDSGKRVATSMLAHMIGGPIIQSLLLGCLVLYLTPLMLGGDEAMPLGFFAAFAWPITKACLLAMVLTFAMMFMPLVGGIVANTPGVDAFIQGMIIFRLFSAAFIEHFIEQAGLQVANLYPSIWACLGYFALAMVFVYISLVIFAALGTTISRKQYSEESGISFFVGMALIYSFHMKMSC
jgi:hypothetical protein